MCAESAPKLNKPAKVHLCHATMFPQLVEHGISKGNHGDFVVSETETEMPCRATMAESKIWKSGVGLEKGFLLSGHPFQHNIANRVSR